MNHQIRFRAVIAAVVTLLTCSLLSAGCAGLFPAEEEELEPPLIQPETIAYRTVTATRGDLVEQLRLNGNFTAENEVALSFTKASGRLKTLLVTNGSEVQKGDLIAELDSESLASSIEIQEIEVEKCRLSLAQLKSNSADSYSIKRAELDLKQQQIRLGDLEKQMAATQIYAPAGGEVTYVISTDVGETVGAYQTIVKISDVSRMNVMTTSENAGKLPVGAEVTIEFSGVEIQGSVIANPSTLSGDPDISMRKAAVIRLTSELPDDASLGRAVTINYILQERKNVLILSRSYINAMSGRYYVNVLEDGVRVEKDVEIGLMTATEVEIIKGIDEKDLIIVN